VDDRVKDAWLAADASPDDAAEVIALNTARQAMIDECAAWSAALLPYVGTVSAARDLEALRAALGERKLNYFGFSYGTWLGAAYAHRFPGSVGRMVLDAAVDTDLNPMEYFRQQAAGFQLALGDYSRWAALQPGHHAGRSMTATITRLLKGLDSRPIRTDSGRPLTQSLATYGVLAALYSRDGWPLLTQATEQALAGNGTILLALSDALYQRDPSGHYTNYLEAATAIDCASTPQRYTEQDVARALPAFVRASPTFGPTFAHRPTACTGWPVGGDPTAHQVDAPTAPPIVVVGTTGDPATPYPWAPALARRLGSGVLLTYKGEGHGAYVTGDRCVQKAVNGYLFDGTAPRDGTRCP
jgi:pimeloyl-ACP methyl ester carboxylesterase